MAEAEQCGRCESVIPKEPAGAVQVLDLIALGAEQPHSLADLEHPLPAYLNGLAPSSRRPRGRRQSTGRKYSNASQI